MSNSQENIEDIPESERTRCEVWTRVMGYHRPIENYNIGKQAEHDERKHFDEAVTMEHVTEQ